MIFSAVAVNIFDGGGNNLEQKQFPRYKILQKVSKSRFKGFKALDSSRASYIHVPRGNLYENL